MLKKPEDVLFFDPQIDYMVDNFNLNIGRLEGFAEGLLLKGQQQESEYLLLIVNELRKPFERIKK